MMRTTVGWVREHVYAQVIDAGYHELGRAHVAMFRYPTLEGLRPTEIADQLQVTKQSVNDLLSYMEEHGYVVRVPDPTDGRARIVHLTAKGRRLEDVVYYAAGSAERAIAELLGPNRFPQLRQSLEEVARCISTGRLSTEASSVHNPR
jgi:DNA-binding MarR family transcriptional regulator